MMRLRSSATLLATILAASAAVPGVAVAQAPVVPLQMQSQSQQRTLAEALAITYSTNPALQAARAALRAVDENVPQALAGWRPQVQFAATAGFADGTNISRSRGVNTSTNAERGLNTQTLQIVQPLYRGGATRAGTNRAENQVISQRASLIAAEQTAFIGAVNAYVSVIQATQVLALRENNVQVLSRQLQATRDRFRVGEITRTDVAQAEASLAGAQADRQTAESDLQTARSQYAQFIGELPGKLIEPQPLRLPAKALDDAREIAANNNPNVVVALFNDAAAKDNVDLQFAKLMPTLSLQGSILRNEDSQTKNLTSKTSQIVLSTTVPIYQGGSEYAAIRQAKQQQQQSRKQIDDARRTAVQALTQAWTTYQSTRAAIESNRQQIRANEIALEGVQREAIVGSRTTLDVLNAEQTLLNSRLTLVQSLARLINASYSVASAAGRLTARDLNLDVPLYDETAYYKAVRNRWIGTSDQATDQPGR